MLPVKRSVPVLTLHSLMFPSLQQQEASPLLQGQQGSNSTDAAMQPPLPQQQQQQLEEDGSVVVSISDGPSVGDAQKKGEGGNVVWSLACDSGETGVSWMKES